MKDFSSNEEFLAALRMVIERWCDARRFDALAQILPAYLAFNGLTDGWVDLADALKAARGRDADAFSQTDWDILNDLIHATDLTLHRSLISKLSE